MRKKIAITLFILLFVLLGALLLTRPFLLLKNTLKILGGPCAVSIYEDSNESFKILDIEKNVSKMKGTYYNTAGSIDFFYGRNGLIINLADVSKQLGIDMKYAKFLDNCYICSEDLLQISEIIHLNEVSASKDQLEDLITLLPDNKRSFSAHLVLKAPEHIRNKKMYYYRIDSSWSEAEELYLAIPKDRSVAEIYILSSDTEPKKYKLCYEQMDVKIEIPNKSILTLPKLVTL